MKGGGGGGGGGSGERGGRGGGGRLARRWRNLRSASGNPSSAAPIICFPCRLRKGIGLASLKRIPLWNRITFTTFTHWAKLIPNASRNWPTISAAGRRLREDGTFIRAARQS